MAIARLIVIEGPDMGAEFSIPVRGGGIGRGEENVVRLTDLSVSRNHCRLELKAGQLRLIDPGSRNKTLVNGEPISDHQLETGDEIKVGTTRLSFLPVVPQKREAPRGSRVTMEVSSRQLLAITGGRLAVGDDRAQRYLTAVAKFGDSIGSQSDHSNLSQQAAQTCLSALAADRVSLLIRKKSGALTSDVCATNPTASTTSALDDDPFDPPDSLVEKVLGEGKCIALRLNEQCTVVAAPLVVSGRAVGLVAAERSGEPAWDQIDLTAIACLANLMAGAFEGLNSRESLVRENRDLKAEIGSREFVGQSARAAELLRFVAKVAPTEATVLLTGESGSGKEMIARSLHNSSNRSDKPFVAVNCAALTQSLIESELFGHEKGAFTGATDRKIGRFEAADSGTLFLDEVGELPLDCQTKFLRVLEEQTFERVGGTDSLTVNVRVLAATNRDLPQMVRDGTFREDLFYRLSVIHTEVMPLRERPDDIALLAEHFLARLKRQVPRRILGFAPEAIETMKAYRWPGNIRELRNAVERAIVMGDDELIAASDLPREIISGSPLDSANGAATTRPAIVEPASASTAPLPLRELERRGIVAALAATSGNKAQAANLLQIDRSTLYKKIKDYGL